MTDLRAAAQQFVSDYENGDLGDLKHYARALRAALAQQEQEVSDPTDPGHDVDVLREQVRHLERRVRELHAKPEQEPVAWLTDRQTMYSDKEDARRDCDGFIQPLYTRPAEPEPQPKPLNGLTQEQAREWLTEVSKPLEQEPVAWIQPDHLQKARVAPFLCRVEPTKRMADFVAIYTTPPRREWRGLTDEEIYLLYSEPSSDAEMVEFARAVERALKEKNSG